MFLYAILIFCSVALEFACYNPMHTKYNASDLLETRRQSNPQTVEKELMAPAPSDSNRIVRGNKTSIEKYPYQASFQFLCPNGDTVFCGGFIISENYVLTAAHCVINAIPSLTLLRLGSSFPYEGMIVPVASLAVHPNYNTTAMFDSDVGVVRTENPIIFSDTIRPIPLPPLGRPVIAGTLIVVAGWGDTLYGLGTVAFELREVELPVVSHFKCTLTYNILTKNEFCAGIYTGGMGTCQGDSGGAAVQDDMAVGIVSFARGCGFPLSPSVFVNLAAKSIRTFIYEETGL